MLLPVEGPNTTPHPFVEDTIKRATSSGTVELSARHAHNLGHIVLRTYLTSAAGYRRHIADGTAGDDLKDALLSLHLPHFTWIIEIATTDSYNHFSAGMRRTYGHTIIDATSTGRDGAGLLALHLPGLLFTKDVNAPPDEQEELTIIEGDDLYECRAKHL